MKTSKRLSG